MESPHKIETFKSDMEMSPPHPFSISAEVIPVNTNQIQYNQSPLQMGPRNLGAVYPIDNNFIIGNSSLPPYMAPSIAVSLFNRYDPRNELNCWKDQFELKSAKAIVIGKLFMIFSFGWLVMYIILAALITGATIALYVLLTFIMLFQTMQFATPYLGMRYIRQKDYNMMMCYFIFLCIYFCIDIILFFIFIFTAIFFSVHVITLIILAVAIIWTKQAREALGNVMRLERIVSQRRGFMDHNLSDRETIRVRNMIN